MEKALFKVLKHEAVYRPLQELSYKTQNLLDITLPKYIRQLLSRVRKNTMVDYVRIRGLALIAQKIEDDNMQGAFVECGVWRGGCSAVMAYLAKSNAESKKRAMRNVYLFDSFEGLPHVTEHDGVGALAFSSNKTNGELKPIGQNVSSEETVRALFTDLGLDLPNVHIVKGWFQDTLPVNKDKIGQIALLRLDGDWYESTKVCLENLYANVVSGGYIVFDDYYFWAGCRRAVDEFLENNSINVKLVRQGFSGVYFIKP